MIRTETTRKDIKDGILFNVIAYPTELYLETYPSTKIKEKTMISFIVNDNPKIFECNDGSIVYYKGELMGFSSGNPKYSKGRMMSQIEFDKEWKGKGHLNLVNLLKYLINENFLDNDDIIYVQSSAPYSENQQYLDIYYKSIGFTDDCKNNMNIFFSKVKNLF